ncbi:mucosa-associated lymphoid tissue lymphoma translocation protein 1 [Rhincodon typus]|uniref:mucosa-associated lymphoid tissue lymphoma translocation protein 1 n=1 Tax=Rhincodon typus TaxID=259920 RepID=UPI0020301C00|nr:mucosa-associated lymphoid tissue lymphoma translocation protein 1 [Rhincodon typus]
MNSHLPALTKPERCTDSLPPEKAQTRELKKILAERRMSWGERSKKNSTLQSRERTGIVITKQPESASVPAGCPVTLQCVAVGPSPLQYQWFKGQEEIAAVEMRHYGTYLCAVTNDQGECWSSAADLSVVEIIPIAVALPPLRVAGSRERKVTAKSPSVCRKPDTPQEVRLCATDKVALLIGNMNYVNHPKLLATVIDVFELSNLLHQLNFRVVSLMDLTKEEMQSAVKQFLQLLDTGVYALFYYAGHGYECSGRNYMVPVNAPNPYRPENCINVQKILCKMQAKNTALNVVLLDMCRKWYNQEYFPSDLQPLAPTGNIVYGYATCEDAEAYEVQDGEYSSGIFMKYLKRHILKKEKVTQILENVSEEMGKDQLITGKQVMEIRHTLKECRALTDEICAKGHTVQLQVRNERWKQANELPKRRTIWFPCGVAVELSCSAVFSNVMIVYANVKTRPSDITECKVFLRKPEELASACSDLNGESSQIDSLLSSLNGDQQSDTTLKVCGLHKLEQPLILWVTLQYWNFKEHAKLEETTAVNLGHPLVAQLELYRTMPSATTTSSSGTNQDSTSVPDTTVTKDTSSACRSGTRIPINRRELQTSLSQARRSNQPEENDESEISFGDR